MNTQLIKLMEYKLGGHLESVFEQKLREQTGWSKHFCQKAMIEYKRFAYLASKSSSPITPSQIIDEVWHLHLTFSRCYWGEFCPNLLNYPLHHEPATQAEVKTTENQYRHTLLLYKRHFNAVPPSEFWPVIPKKVETQNGRSMTKALAFLAMLFAGFTATASELDSSGDSSMEFWLILVAVIFFGLFAIIGRGKSDKHKKGSRGAWFCSGGGECSSGCGGGGCGGD